MRKFEQDSDPAPLIALFATDAVTERLDARGERQGEVEEFWKEYRAQFHEIRTTFFNVVEGDDQFALEWTSTGTLSGGRPIDYRGVTSIDLDGDPDHPAAHLLRLGGIRAGPGPGAVTTGGRRTPGRASVHWRPAQRRLSSVG